MSLEDRLIHRVVPHLHEDIVGLLIRIAERNYLDGPGAILFERLGGRPSTVRTADLPRIAEYCRLYVEEMLHLSGIERRLSDGSQAWQVCGEWLTKASFVSSTRVKVCPQCLQESPYVRGVWHLCFYTVCARHDVRLVHDCPVCRRPIKWDRRQVGVCACGGDLTEAPAITVRGRTSLIAKLLARRSDSQVALPASSALSPEIERLAELSLDGLCKTLWFLGHCLGSLGQYGAGHGRWRPQDDDAETIAATALEILEDWPWRLGERLQSCTQRSPSNGTGTLLDRLLGPVQHYFQHELQGSELAFLRIAYEQHIRMIWRTLGKEHRQRNAERQLEFDF